MSNFRVGQKVVCVSDDALESDGVKRLQKGRVYTVRKVQSDYSSPGWLRLGDGPVLWVKEIETRGNGDHPYCASRFRPAVERKTDISIFKAMLEDKKARVRA